MNNELQTLRLFSPLFPHIYPYSEGKGSQRGGEQMNTNTWGATVITLNDLMGDQRELAEIIGIEAYINLVSEWGRDVVYIGKCDKIIKKRRNEQIRKEFSDGFSVKALAKRYALTERRINGILIEERRQLKIAPGEGQLSLF